MSEMDVRGDEVQPGDETPADVHVEAPEADVAEQRRTLQEDERKWPLRIPFDADPADVTEQERTVDLDEDDYR